MAIGSKRQLQLKPRTERDAIPQRNRSDIPKVVNRDLVIQCMHTALRYRLTGDKYG